MAKLFRIAGPILGAVLLVAAASPASAVPVLWTLSRFEIMDLDPTGHHFVSATGSFVYDAATNTYSAIDITTEAGTIRGGDRYTQLSSGLPHGPEQVLFLGEGADETEGAPALALFFWTPLTDAGGVVELEQGTEAACSPGCTTHAEPYRLILGGRLTGTVLGSDVVVPEPTSAGSLFTGLVALVALVLAGRGRRLPATVGGR
jgi:hypothetical protein